MEKTEKKLWFVNISEYHHRTMGLVSGIGHKFLAFSIKLAQLFHNTVFLLSRTGKTSNSHLEKISSHQI